MSIVPQICFDNFKCGNFRIASLREKTICNLVRKNYGQLNQIHNWKSP